jgi:hypothetical protein
MNVLQMAVCRPTPLKKQSTPFHSSMPNAHGLAVVVEVDPATTTGDNFPPLSRVTHHNLAAKRVVPVVECGVVQCSGAEFVAA